MLAALLATVIGLALLIWSADRFVSGAAVVSRYLGMPPLLIGMVVVGFGTSAPEMTVSALAASAGSPGLALGNAYGSNITNIALVLGLVALFKPITVQSGVLRLELPVLVLVTLFAGILLLNGFLSRLDGLLLLLVFVALLCWSLVAAVKHQNDSLGREVSHELAGYTLSRRQAWFWLGVGLVMLLVSSQVLVWGSVQIARGLGVSELVIGLTVLAVGTSLPELVSSLVAMGKGEHDLALGNIIGSNLFNTLGVVGIAATIHPLAVEPPVLTRDWPLMAALTLALVAAAWGFRGPGRINRLEGGLLVLVFILYMGYLGYLMSAA